MDENPMFLRLILPLIFIVAGFLLGFILEGLLPALVRRIAAEKTWETVGRDIRILRGMVVLWTTLAGIWAAVSYVGVHPAWLLPLQRALLVFVILSVTLVLAQVAVALVRLYAARAEGGARATSILTNLTRLTLLLIGVLIALDSLGISIMPALTALGVAGLAVALALQSTLANLFAGLQILASKQLRTGDYVKLDSGEEGCVMDIAWRTTTIRTIQNNLVFVPNSKMASASITNYNLPEKELDVTIPVSLNAGADLDTVRRAVAEMAREVLRDLHPTASAEPQIRYASLADPNINLTVILRARDYEAQQKIRDEFLARLLLKFRNQGIIKTAG